MRRAVLILGAIAGIGVVAVLGIAYFLAQRADYGWSPSRVRPAFTTTHPTVLIDEGHNNASAAGFTGRYWPLARLLRADGFDVVRGHRRFSVESLAGVRVLVIANASGAPKPQLFGLNLPVFTTRRRSDPAFDDVEIAAVRSWVDAGGSLLLVADHAPFGQAAAGLASSLGVTMHTGFVEVPSELSDPLIFSQANGRLGTHVIIQGDRPGTAAARVMTYTGQSLDGPPGSTVLLQLPGNAIEGVPVGGDSLAERPAGPAQGLAFAYGKGRVVVLGEGAMLTAQVARRVPYGINDPRNDNLQFTLNTFHWLASK